MTRNVKNGSDSAGTILGQLAAEKKKVAIASCLIALMAVMWIKLLTKKEPQAAHAQLQNDQAQVDGQSAEQPKVSFVELPELPGRNDVISTDFFDVDDWRQFEPSQNHGNTIEVSSVSSNASQEVIARIARQLKLQAIGWNEEPQASINDKLLSAGGRLTVSDGNWKYECEVVEIGKNFVVLRCEETEVRLQLVQNAETED